MPNPMNRGQGLLIEAYGFLASPILTMMHLHIMLYMYWAPLIPLGWLVFYLLGGVS